MVESTRAVFITGEFTKAVPCVGLSLALELFVDLLEVLCKDIRSPGQFLLQLSSLYGRIHQGSFYCS